jgi:hypothetical protein
VTSTFAMELTMSRFGTATTSVALVYGPCAPAISAAASAPASVRHQTQLDRQVRLGRATADQARLLGGYAAVLTEQLDAASGG